MRQAARAAKGMRGWLEGSMSTTEPFELRLGGITKVYPGVVALNDVSLHIRSGETVGLIGENGAGKSTLMKILGGVVRPTRGTITIDNEDHAGLTVHQSMQAGIAFVHQELNVFDNLDVCANILLGREISHGPFGLMDRREMMRTVQPILDRVGARFGPGDNVADLSIAEQQLLEIAKALSVSARLVIMDEPTSSLTIAETARLLDVIAELKANGIAILFISHRLAEIEQCADRVVVLRDGRNVGELTGDDIRHDAMIRLMIGRNLEIMHGQHATRPGSPKLVLNNVRTAANPSVEASLTVHAGEIVGLAGLVGAGRTELARTIFGIDAPLGGDIMVDGVPLVRHGPGAAIDAGIAMVPEDRKDTGLVLDFAVSRNIALPSLEEVSVRGLVSSGLERRRAEEQRSRLDIKVPDVESAAAELSGGNQQKVVLGKWLSKDPQIIIFDEPTRGIDVGAKAEIYRLMRELADRGVAILMISSDMEEVIGVSDRIAVMCRGSIRGILDRGDFSEHNVLTLAVG